MHTGVSEQYNSQLHEPSRDKLVVKITYAGKTKLLVFDSPSGTSYEAVKSEVRTNLGIQEDFFFVGAEPTEKNMAESVVLAKEKHIQVACEETWRKVRGAKSVKLNVTIVDPN